MAKYDYKCEICKTVFEITRKMTVSDPVFCEECNTLAERAITYAPSVKFVGDGWYTNDSKHVDGSIFDAGQSHELS